ncbi:hypothetical protein ABQF26_01665 [Mycolicibacterium elephantis]
MTFGNQTITFVSVTENLEVRTRYNRPEQVRTETSVAGCRFRIVSVEEQPQKNGGIKVVEKWKLTAPPVAAAMNATAHDELEHDGITYSITGVKTHRDFASPHHVTITAERWRG